MLINERNIRRERILEVAKSMMTAARTAPKGKGIDIIEVILLTDETITQLSKAMEKFSEKSGLKFLLRDAENILQSEAIVVIGTAQQVQNLNCGYCGFETCAAKNAYPEVPCSLNTTDVGIAIGSAVKIASELNVDNRIMYRVGVAAMRLGMVNAQIVHGVPLSATGKNIFFDRQPKK